MTTEAWDPSLQSFETPFDGRIISAIGGATGKITLLNGKQIVFPYKRQQETDGTLPSTMYVYEGVSGGNTVEITIIKAATLNNIAEANQPALQLTSSYTAGDAGQAFLGMGNDPYILLLRNAGVATIQLKGRTEVFGVLATDGNVDVTGTLTANAVGSVTTVTANGAITGGSLIVSGLADVNGGIDVTGGVVNLVSTGVNSVNITSADDVLITAGGTAGLIQIASKGTGNAILAAETGATAQVQGGIANLVSTATTVTVQAATVISLSALAGNIQAGSSAGSYIHLNNGNERTVTVNGYPALALRDRENAAFGTPPAITATVTGFKLQAGRQTVNFVAGAGTLTFLSSFATGLVNVVVCAEMNDAVVAPNPGGGVNAASIALTCFVAGAAAAGNVVISYVACGW